MNTKLLTLILSFATLSIYVHGQSVVTVIPGNGNIAYGISTSGNYVTGTDGTGGCFLYRVAGGSYLNIGGVEANGVNNNGKVVGSYLDSSFQYNGVSFPIAGTCSGGLWSTPGLVPGMTPVSNSQYSYGYGISEDGLTFCGMVWKNAGKTNSYVWNATSGYVILRDRNQSSKAMCISGNGAIEGGWVQGNMRLPFFWNPDSVLLDPNVGEVHGINYTGSMMVGTAGGSAFMWDSTNGMQYIPTYTGAASANAYGVSDIGSIVGLYGNGGFPSTNNAFIYFPSQGMLNLRDFLVSVNATNVPASFDAALGISRDGKYIIAYGGSPRISYVIELDSAVISGIQSPSANKDWFYVGPNPVNGETINIKGVVSGSEKTIQLKDITGREILSLPLNDISSGEFQLTVDLKSNDGKKLAPGIYMLNLVTKSNIISRKIIVN